MTHHQNLKILAFVGLSGSGKTTAVDYFTEKDFPKVYFGGVIIDAVKAAGLEVNEANERMIREKVREEEGKDFVVKRVIDQIRHLADAGQHRIIADGLYTWTEYKMLKSAFPGEITVVAVVTPRHLRYKRLQHRPVRPLTEHEANERDWSEIERLEKGGPIAIADYFVHNDGDLESFQKQLSAIAETVEFTNQ